MNTPNNPPAFPLYTSDCSRSEQGMTLRDYFAAKAMAAQLANPYTGQQYNEGKVSKDEQKQFVSKNAYEVADAMLEERAK